MKTLKSLSEQSGRQEGSVSEITIRGYPVSSSREKYFRQYREQKNLRPGFISGARESSDNCLPVTTDVNFIRVSICGRYLKIPLSEIDDNIVIAISDDEENRFYSSEGDGRCISM